jgi:8-oxo-dGTP pyrophosphatase MutT (NUDIX family)
VCLVSDGRYWGFPKGIVERGEEPLAAALREIAEETGLDRNGLHVIAPLSASEYVYRRGTRLIFKRVHFFLVTAPKGAELTPQADELTAAEWLTFDAARARASFSDTVNALSDAERLLASESPGSA